MLLAAFLLWMILQSNFQKNCSAQAMNFYGKGIFTFLALTQFLFSVEVERDQREIQSTLNMNTYKVINYFFMFVHRFLYKNHCKPSA